MRVFITSDPHLGVNNRGDRAVKEMASYLQKIGTSQDVLMILGDLATCDFGVSQCLGYFSCFPGKKLAVAGNHDIWVYSEEGRDSNQRYQQLGQLCRQKGFTLLDQESVIVDGIGFVGGIGWYDYSFRDLLDIPIEAYKIKVFPGEEEICWQDACLAKWESGDQEVVEQQLRHLQSQLDWLKTAQIIVGMHHAPTKSLLFHPRHLIPARWRFRNAFLGSTRFEELFAKYASRITHVFCGHIHRHSSVIEQGIHYTSVGSTYKRKELITLESGKQLSKMIF